MTLTSPPQGGPESATPVRTTASGIPLKPVYGPADVPSGIAAALATPPGSPPYLRGAYPEMYRTRPWRIFQLSGFGNPEDERDRIKFLLSHGATGFIMELDRMTADHLYDVDHHQVVARHEDVGLNGAVKISLRDFTTALDGIPIERVYGHAGAGVVQYAPFALACYWSVAEQRGIPLDRLSGTGQSDFFLTYLGCLTKEQIPARAGLRLSCDIIEFCLERLPHWVPVSIAGYNGAETGLNAWEELGAVFANAVAYLDEVLARGRLTADALAHAIGGISLRTSMDLFEDAAKFRVARSMWHDLLRDRYGVQDERALRLRIHGLTSGAAMTYQQPLNNIVRGTVMALAAVLGGVQSLGVSAYDEAISIPSEHAHQLSVRIQQILQNECNLTAVVDPLGGSYYLEHLCGELEQRAWEFFREIEARGGFIATLDSGWLHERAHRRQVEREEALTSGAMRMVGVNCFEDGDDLIEPAGFEGTPDAWERAVERLGDLRRDRDEGQARAALARLEAVCRSKDNVMPAMMAAVQAGASIGEVGRVFREVFGIWDIPITF